MFAFVVLLWCYLLAEIRTLWWRMRWLLICLAEFVIFIWIKVLSYLSLSHFLPADQHWWAALLTLWCLIPSTTLRFLITLLWSKMHGMCYCKRFSLLWLKPVFLSTLHRMDYPQWRQKFHWTQTVLPSITNLFLYLFIWIFILPMYMIPVSLKHSKSVSIEHFPIPDTKLRTLSFGKLLWQHRT